jgi:hypothetical protein
MNKLPDADRIQGMSLERGQSPKESYVMIQYTDHKQQWHEVRVPFLSAMYLLNMLKQLQADMNFHMPDPREGPGTN